MEVNLDANASYGVIPEVWERVRSMPTTWLNPNSVHQGGQRARSAIEEAREEVRLLIGASASDRIVFTSGATEANNMAAMLPFGSNRHGSALVTTSIEHPSLLEATKRLTRIGIECSVVAPLSDGEFDATALVNACTAQTKLVSLMLANNETGEIFPVKEIARMVSELLPEVVLHSDVAQAVGKTPVSFPDLGVHMVTLSAHKIGGLCGVGALVVNEAIPCHPLIVGGSQETGWRGGTENVLGILSFGVAARVARERLQERMDKMRHARDFLAQEIFSALPVVKSNVLPECATLPNTLNLRVPGVRADDLVVALDLQGVLISSGAACASGKPLPSHVLLAKGLTPCEARESIRISLRGEYEAGTLEQAAQILITTIERMMRHG